MAVRQIVIPRHPKFDSRPFIRGRCNEQVTVWQAHPAVDPPQLVAHGSIIYPQPAVIRDIATMPQRSVKRRDRWSAVSSIR